MGELHELNGRRAAPPPDPAAESISRIARGLHKLMVNAAKEYLAGNAAIPENWDEVIASPVLQQSWAKLTLQVAASVLEELAKGLPLRPLQYEHQVRQHERSRCMRWAALEQRRVHETGDLAGALILSEMSRLMATKPTLPGQEGD